MASSDAHQPGTPAYIRIVANCGHDWREKATFSRGMANLRCARCGHLKVRLPRRR